MDILKENNICVANWFHIGYVDTTGVTNRGIGFSLQDLCEGLYLSIDWREVCNQVLSSNDIVYKADRCRHSFIDDKVEYITGYDYIKYISLDAVMKVIDFAQQTEDGKFINLDKGYYGLHNEEYWYDKHQKIEQWFKTEAIQIKCGTIDNKYDFLEKYGFEFEPLRDECIKIIVPHESYIGLRKGRLCIHYKDDFLAIPFEGGEEKFNSIMNIFNFDWKAPMTILNCSNLFGLGFKGKNTHFCYADSDCTKVVDKWSYSEKWNMKKEGFKTIELKTTNALLDLHILSENLDWEYKGHVVTLEKLKSIFDLFGVEYNK